MKTLALWLCLIVAPVGIAAPPTTTPDVALISCTQQTNSTHLAVTAWSASVELDPAIFATGECAVILANLLGIGYNLQMSAGNASGGGNTVYTLTTGSK